VRREKERLEREIWMQNLELKLEKEGQENHFEERKRNSRETIRDEDRSSSRKTNRKGNSNILDKVC
jgi:hypothetical protein